MAGMRLPRMLELPQTEPGVKLREGCVVRAGALARVVDLACKFDGRDGGRGDVNMGAVDAKATRSVVATGAGVSGTTSGSGAGPDGRVRSIHGRGLGRISASKRTIIPIVEAGALAPKGGRVWIATSPSSVVGGIGVCAGVCCGTAGQRGCFVRAIASLRSSVPS